MYIEKDALNKKNINTLYQHNMNDEFQNQIKDES